MTACQDTERPATVEEERLRRNMAAIAVKLLVVSGKGGVGKSTVAVNIAAQLAREGHRVGLLDADVHGPSVPVLLRASPGQIKVHDGLIEPILVDIGRTGKPAMKVMSIGYFLKTATEAVIWRGPRKFGLIRQFLRDVQWDSLDYLVVDCPPGTGDEPLTVAQLVGRPSGAVIVTTPQSVAVNDVRRCVTFCRSVDLPIIGIIENMSGFVCPHCGAATDIFGRGGGQRLADEMQTPFLGNIPLDPMVLASGETGSPFVNGAEGDPTIIAFGAIVQRIRGSQP